MKRREFIEKSVAAGAMGMVATGAMGMVAANGRGMAAANGREMVATGAMVPGSPSSGASPEHATGRRLFDEEKDDISIAQWALVREIREGKWKTLDFPRIAREDFDINGIEFVNTLFEVPHVNYLNQLKRNAGEHGVDMVLIMVDAEGDPCVPDRKGREQFGINHRKWIDIAHYLGCHSIRTNCRGREGDDPEECLRWAADSYRMLLEYASGAGINVLIENHGGVSNDAGWMERLFSEVDHPLFGSYPDWRQPSDDFDNVQYLEKMLPFARGMSYRNQPDDLLSARMIRLCRKMGYRGWYGIESQGREAIRKGKEILTEYLELKS